MAQVIPQVFIALVLGFAARVLLGSSKRSLLKDDTGTALAKRGSRIPYLIGTDKLGSLFAHIGDHQIKKEKVGGKKGGGSAKQDVWYETGWHHLSIGPGTVLHEIQENGKVLFTGPITPTDSPSGTPINIGNGETFIIWWGEPTQPTNTQFETQTGVASRWPHLFSIWWQNKRLGTSHTWPLLEYVVETELVTSLLTQTPGTTQSQPIPLPTSHAIRGIDGTIDSISINGHHAHTFPDGTQVDILGTGFLDVDGIKTVDRAENHTVGQLGGSLTRYTQIVLVTAFTSVDLLNPAGEIRILTQSTTRRNPAHILAQLLFEPSPHGMGFPTDDFDIESLEEVGVRLQAEGILGRLSLAGSDRVEDAVGRVLVDTNCMVFLDTRSGKYRFRLIRELAGPAPAFSRRFLHEIDPESTIPILGKNTSKAIYSFKDREFNHEEMTVGGIDHDASFHRLENADADVYEMYLPVEIVAASVIAELRSQGDLGEGSAVSLDMMRGARELVPSMQIDVEGVLERLLISSVEFRQGENKVGVEAISDYVGARLSSFEHGSGAPPEPDVLPPTDPVAARILEVPAYISPGLQIVTVPAIRAHQQISHHELWISGTGVSYTHAGRQTQVQTGGILIEAIAADTDHLLDPGALFEALGVDLQDRVLDLTGNETDWRAGRQVAVIDDEILFLEGVVAAGGGQWRLGRSLRGRFDTRRQAHAIGATVFIFETNELFPIVDPLLFPGATLFAKPQAVGNGSVPIEDVIELSAVLIGKGVAPLAPVALRARGDSLPTWCRGFVAGDDVLLRWQWQSFSTANTGAGMQASGNPTGPASVQGEFRIEFLTAAGTLRASYLTSSTTFTYTNAQLVSDFTSEPSSFKARVLEILGGRESTNIEILITRI